MRVVAAAAVVVVLSANGCGDLARRGGVPDASEVRTVVRVVDGDTIIVDPDERVRLIGVDAPSP